MKTSHRTIADSHTSAEPFTDLKTGELRYFSRTLNFSQVAELDELIGGGGVELVLILFDFPLGSPAPHSHNPSCLTSHDPLTTFSDYWTTSAPVLNVSNPPGRRPVAPPIHPADVHFPMPHFYTRRDPPITFSDLTAMHRDAFPSKNMLGAIMQLFGEEMRGKAIRFFRVESPQACDACVCVDGGGPAWLASLSALHPCNNRDRPSPALFRNVKC